MMEHRLTKPLADLPSLPALASLVVVAFVLRFLAALVLAEPPTSDSMAYLSMATNLLNGQGIVDFMGNKAMYNVGYSLFVIAPVFAIFGENMTALYGANSLLGAITTLLMVLLAREAGAQRSGQIIAALLWIIFIPGLLLAGFVAKEHLMLPLMISVLWCTLRTARQPGFFPLILGGISFGLLALVANAGLVLGLAALTALITAPASGKFKLQGALIVALLTAGIATPWLVRNHQQLGHATLNTNGGFNIYLGNNDAATGRFVSISDTPVAPQWESMRTEGEWEASNQLKVLARQWIAENPKRFLELALVKGAHFWSPGSVDSDSSLVKLIKWLRAGEFIALILLALTSLYFACNRQTSLLWLAIISYTAVHMVFYVILRYRFPIMPAVLVLAALTLEYCWLRWRASR